MKDVAYANDLVKARASVATGLLTSEDREEEAGIQRAELGGVNFYAHRGPDFEKVEVFAETIFSNITLLEDKKARPRLVDTMFDVRPGQYGKIYRFRRFFGGKVFERSYGGYKRRSTIRAEHYTLSTYPRSLVIEIAVEDLKAGIITASDIVVILMQAVERHKVGLAWSTWTTALAVGGAFCDDYTGNVSQDELNTVINEVADITDPGVIIARRTLLTPIVSFLGYDATTGYSEKTKEEIHSSGFLGGYSGVTLAPIKSWAEELYDDQAVIPATDILILPKDLSLTRFAEVGGLQRSSRVEQDTSEMIFYVDLEDGAAIFETKYARRLRRTGA